MSNKMSKYSDALEELLNNTNINPHFEKLDIIKEAISKAEIYDLEHPIKIKRFSIEFKIEFEFIYRPNDIHKGDREWVRETKEIMQWLSNNYYIFDRYNDKKRYKILSFHFKVTDRLRDNISIEFDKNDRALIRKRIKEWLK